MLRVALTLLLAAATTVPATSSTSAPLSTPPTSATSSTSTTTTPGATTSTTVALPTEVPGDEAQLLALLDTARAHQAELNTRIGDTDRQLAANQARLDAANAGLAAAQQSAAVADGRLAFIRLAQAGALVELRRVAIAAYIHEPAGELANLLLHLNSPDDLLDASAFYKIVVGAADNALGRYIRLTRAATTAASKADHARDLATHKQQAVAALQQDLQAVRQTLVGVQQALTDEQAKSNTLVNQLGRDKAEFEAELAKLQEESDSITALLASLAQPGQTPPAPTGGYFTDPVPGAPITQRFGPNSDPFTGIAGFHPGVDFGAPLGTQIHAAGDGTVVFAGEESGYGNYTCINHGQEIATCYGHQSTLLVKQGDTVVRNQVIGLVGSTGYSTGPHLHFEVRISGTPVDPLPWLTEGTPSTSSTSKGP